MTDLDWKAERGNVWNAETATDSYVIRPLCAPGSMKTLELTVNGKPQDVDRVLNQTALKTLMDHASWHAEMAPFREALIASF